MGYYASILQARFSQLSESGLQKKQKTPRNPHHIRDLISGMLEIVSIDSALRFSSYRAKVDRLDEYNASDQR